MRKIGKIWKKCLATVMCSILVALAVFPNGVYAVWDSTLNDATIEVVDSAVSPSNITINLFDYTLGEGPDGWDSNALAFDNFPWYDDANLKSVLRDGDINYNHALLFGKGIIDGADIPGAPYNGVDPWGIWNWCGSGDTMARQGIVKSTLVNGYPMLDLENLKNNYQSSSINGSQIDSISAEELGDAPLEESLAYLFNPDTPNRTGYWNDGYTTNDAANSAVENGDKTDADYPAAGKQSYTNVKGLLQYGTYDNEHGSKFHNSFYYDSQQNYAKYDETSNSFLLYSQPRIAASDASVTARGQFFPFVDIPALNTTNAVDDINHYFGMTVETEFYMPENGMIGDEPMIFYFSGDDDAWIFVDGVLVGDVGGMHSPIGVTINFSDGTIKYTGSAQNKNSTLEEAFGKASTEFNDSTFAEGTKHTLKMFYLERGNYDSNLALSFNLYNPYSDYMLENKVVDKDGNQVDDDDTKFLFDIEFDRADVVTGLLRGEYGYVTDSGETGIVVITVPNPNSNAVGKITEIKDADGNHVDSSTYFVVTEGEGLFDGETVYQASLANKQWIKILSLPDKVEVKTTENQTNGYKLQKYTVNPEENVADGNTSTGDSAEVVAKLYPFIADDVGDGSDIDEAMTGLTTTIYYNTKIPDGNLVVSKAVEQEEGITPPDEEFKFALTIGGQTGSLVAQRITEGSGPDAGETSEDVTLNFTNSVADFTLKANQSLRLALPIGTEYTVAEKMDELSDDFSFKEVSVNGTVVEAGADTEEGAAAGEMPSTGAGVTVAFVNRYAPEVTAVLEGSKTLDGRDFDENDEFTFVIASGSEDVDNQEPLPQKTRITIYPGKNSVEGITPAEDTLAIAGSQFVFGGTGNEITFTKPGTYHYIISEANPTRDNVISGVTYDTTRFRATINVVWDDTAKKLRLANGADGEPKGIVYESRRADETSWTVAADGIEFVNIYTETELPETKLTFKATKNLLGRDFKEGDSFTFTMTGSEGAPMPEGTEEDVYTTTISYTDGSEGSMTGDSYEFDFAEITYTLDNTGKTYTYELTEKKENTNGIIYDETPKQVRVDVTGNSAETLTATATYPDRYPETADRVIWTNSYVAESGEAVLSIRKEITGRDWSDDLDNGAYSFTLKSVTEGAPMPLDGEGNPLISETVKNVGHQIAFSQIKYTENGVYEYQITEEDSTVPGVIKDEGVINVKVTVTDDTVGSLVAVPEYSYVKDDQNTPDKNTFINTYKSEDASVSLIARKDVGDGYTMTGGEFNFHIRPADSNPASDPIKEGFVFNDENGKIVFAENAVYTAEGTYRYDVHELSGKDGQQTIAGVIYDDTVFAVTVNVKNNPETGTLEASVTYRNVNNGSEAGSVVFDNGYIPLNTSVLLWGNKTLNGKKLEDNEFTFELTPVSASYEEGNVSGGDGSVSGGNGSVSGGNGSVSGGNGSALGGNGTVSGGNGSVSGGEGSVLGGNRTAVAAEVPVREAVLTEIPMPISATTKNTAAGIFEFGEITFTKAGTYTYKITEVNDNKPGYTYDNKEYTVTVNVVDAGGQLTATVAGLDAVKFVNSYEDSEPTPEEPTPEKPAPEKPAPEKPAPTPQPAPTTGNSSGQGNSTVAVNSPKTSDESKIMFWIALCVLAMAVEGGMVLVKRRRK